MKFKKIRIFTLEKRQRFVITTLILTLLLLAAQLTSIEYRHLIILASSMVAYLLTAWSLAENIKGIEWVVLFILPVFYTVAVGLFYFLLPVRWLTRLPVGILYGIGFYALLATENIFNIAAQRTIQLWRAAYAVGYLITLIVAFLLFDTILSFRLIFWLNGLLFFMVSLPLILQLIWSIDLAEKISLNVFKYSLFLSLALAEIVMALSFWPISPTVGALFMTSVLYVFLGLAQYHFTKQLFKREVLEFVLITMSVFVLIFLTTQWGG